MPVLNSLGEAIQNAPTRGPLSDAAGTILIEPVGNTKYLTDTVAVFQDQRADQNTVRIYDLPSRTVRAVPPGGYGPANRIVAGGGVWAAWTPSGGYFDSQGTSGRTSWYPMAVDASTGVRLLSSPQNIGLALWNGLTETVLTTQPLGPHRDGAISQGQVVSSDAAGRLIYFPAQPAWVALPRLINFAMRGGWLTGWSTIWNGLVLWRLGADPMGYLLSTGDNFYADVAPLASGLVRVVASSGAGCLTGELLTYDVDPSAHTVNSHPAVRVNLLTGPTPVPPDQPIPPDPPVEHPQPEPPAESDTMTPVMLPDGPELDAFRASEGAAFDAQYGPLLDATNGVGEASEVNSYLRTHHQMDGDRALLMPLMLENALRKRTGTSALMAASIDAAVAGWRRLRGGR